MKQYHVGQLNFPDPKEVVAEIGLAERNNNDEPYGYTHEFEQELSTRLRVKNVIAVGNGTYALMIALKALNLKGEIIVPSFTFVATIQAIIWSGLKPVFCDVEHESHMISTNTVRAKITQNTVAVMGVHLWGSHCYNDDLASLCEKHNLTLLFDAAHAFGSETHEGSIAQYGQMACYSFHATKILNAAEGGCIATNNDAFAERVKNLVYDNDDFLNVRMSPMQSAIGRLSLREYSNNAAHNKASYFRYINKLCECRSLSVVECSTTLKESNYQYLVIEIKLNSGFNKLDLMKYMRKKGILIRDYFSPPIHKLNFAEKYISAEDDLSNTDNLSQCLVQFPIGQKIRLDDIDWICDQVLSFEKSLLTY